MFEKYFTPKSVLFYTIKNGIKLSFDFPVSNFNLAVFGKFGMICLTKQLARRVLKMSKKMKKIKDPKKDKKRNNSLTFSELKEMVKGFSDDEFNDFHDLLLSRQHKPLP